MTKTPPAAVEEFKPVPVRRGEGFLAEALFAARLLIDLQLLTCVRFLKPHLAMIHGRVLDVGCGDMPFRSMLPGDATYVGIDVAIAEDFGMAQSKDIVNFDGRLIPFPDASFDCVLCTEVLEHAEDPVALLDEMKRVLCPGGVLIATVPFAARVHHAPHDFHRFTHFRLRKMLSEFASVEINERGDDLAVIANKLIVVAARLSKKILSWRLPLFMLASCLAVAAVLLAHASLLFGWGSKADPLGYGIVARKA
jgi:SAM-dependent methyltransferase